MQLEMFLIDNTYLFLLILIRYLGLFIITPLFSSSVVLNRIKVGLALLLTVVSFPVLQNLYSPQLPESVIIIVGEVLREVSIGILFGFTVLLIFSAVQLAGKLIDLRMGFRIANELDPVTGISAPIMGQFKNILATLTFLVINGHLILIRSLFATFDIIPPGKTVFENLTWQFMFRSSADLFIIGFQIALPIVGTVFMIDILLGFLARTVPQMNIFIVGLPVKIIAGFIVLLLSLHVSIYFYRNMFENMFEEIIRLINLLV